MNNTVDNKSQLVARTPSHSFADLERMAVAIAKSGLFGAKTAEQALTLMLIAQEEGTGVASAARDYHVIEGRPALKADAMLARFMASGGKVQWNDLSNTKVAATFSHPSADEALKIEWTIEQAAAAGLTNKDNWKKYPRAMLRSRVVSEGVRTIYPAVITGVYTPEEILDGEVEMRDVTPRADRVEPAARASEAPIDVDVETPLPADPVPAKPGLEESELADHKAAIGAAANLTELKNAHARAYKRAHELGDLEALKELSAAKDLAKARLTQAAA